MAKFFLSFWLLAFFPFSAFSSTTKKPSLGPEDYLTQLAVLKLDRKKLLPLCSLFSQYPESCIDTCDAVLKLAFGEELFSDYLRPLSKEQVISRLSHYLARHPRHACYYLHAWVYRKDLSDGQIDWILSQDKLVFHSIIPPPLESLTSLFPLWRKELKEMYASLYQILADKIHQSHRKLREKCGPSFTKKTDLWHREETPVDLFLRDFSEEEYDEDSL